MKSCIKCNEEKDFTEFYKSPTMADGYYNVCKICYSSRENLKSRLKVGFAPLKTDYCECCGLFDVKVDLDHCHDTGMFRGFICRSCNKTLGWNGDTYQSVKDAGVDQMYLDYLRLANYRMGKVV
jgi:hypothetical protein